MDSIAVWNWIFSMESCMHIKRNILSEIFFLLCLCVFLERINYMYESYFVNATDIVKRIVLFILVNRSVCPSALIKKEHSELCFLLSSLGCSNPYFNGHALSLCWRERYSPLFHAAKIILCTWNITSNLFWLTQGADCKRFALLSGFFSHCFELYFVVSVWFCSEYKLCAE